MVATAVGLLVLAIPAAIRHAQAAALLLRFEAQGEVASGLGTWWRHEVVETRRTLETPQGPLDARRYAPAGVEHAPPLLLVHGVHPRGAEVPRLVEFARVMASSGIDVTTPQVTSLTRYRIAPDAVDAIDAAATALARERGLERVGVMGISFSGGLALMAAARQEARQPIAFVVGVGAHHDMVRVARWYAGQPIEDPEGSAHRAEAHPYGAGVLILNTLDVFFSREDRKPAREALETLLSGRRAAVDEYRDQLSPAGRQQLERITNRSDDATLQRLLGRAIEEHEGQLRSVSPAGRLEDLSVPVYLVHGQSDPVVPSVETRWLAHELPPAALEEAVVTPFLRHAERSQKPSWKERLRLVHFMADVLSAADELR